MAETTNLESSLPVPSVQELAIQRPDQVPPRYIRDDDEIGACPSDSSLRVPLIDMAKLVNAETELKSFKNFILLAQTGVTNHGVSDESLEKMRGQVERFFKLPFTEEMIWAQRPGSLEGYGQASVYSENQKIDWNDMIFLKTQPIQNRNLDLWPQNPPQFSPSVDIGPFEKLISEGNPPVYKTMTNAEYFHRSFKRKLEESFIDSLKI